MNEPRFVYTIYIRATREQVWDGILNAEFTRRYWDHVNVSDWQPGSAWEHRRLDDAGTIDLVGRVVESAPPGRLVLTWEAPPGSQNPEKPSRVTFGLQAIGDMVRLTVTHEDFVPDSIMFGKISDGWPRVLSSLKSLLETARPLSTWARSGAA